MQCQTTDRRQACTCIIARLRQVATDYVFVDVEGATRQGTRPLRPVACYPEGREMEISRRPFEAPYVLEHGHRHH